MALPDFFFGNLNMKIKHLHFGHISCACSGMSEIRGKKKQRFGQGKIIFRKTKIGISMMSMNLRNCCFFSLKQTSSLCNIPHWSTLRPTYLRHTPLRYTTPHIATPNPTEIRHTPFTYPTPYWDTPHPTEIHHTLQRYATPYWDTPHPTYWDTPHPI